MEEIIEDAERLYNSDCQIDIYDKNIQDVLPHKYPMLLIDKIVELEKGKKAVGIKNITINERYFQGHFPGNPIMPGVLIIEALAQTGVVALLSNNKSKTIYLAGIKNAIFKKKVVPGDTLKLVTEITKVKGKFVTGNSFAYINSEIVSEAELIFYVE